VALLQALSVTRHMSRFYFQVEGAPDDVGMELPNVGAAKCEAVRYAGRLICEQANSFWDKGDFTMTVRDERGLTLFLLVLSGVDAPVIQVEPQISA
jgi:hypothetical protein